MQTHYLGPSLANMMPISIESESTLTDRYQTTVPESVRRALKLSKRDKIHYSVRSDGEVVLSRADLRDSEDPVLEHFLGFLARDLSAHPERLRLVDVGLVQRIQSLVADAQIDLDSPLAAVNE